MLGGWTRAAPSQLFFFFLESFYCPLAAIPTPLFVAYLGPGLAHVRVREGDRNSRGAAMAEALPALLHVSLFLFFVALADYVLDINITVGLGSVIPIGISGLFYVFATFSQVLYSHSFYQSQNS